MEQVDGRISVIPKDALDPQVTRWWEKTVGMDGDMGKDADGKRKNMDMTQDRA